MQYIRLNGQNVHEIKCKCGNTIEWFEPMRIPEWVFCKNCKERGYVDYQQEEHNEVCSTKQL